MKMVFKITLPALLLAAGVFGTSHLIETKPALEPSPPTERVWTVDAIQVGLEDVQPKIRLFGTIFAVRELQLRALVPGQVVEVHPNLVEGESIRRGELILAIDEFEYRSALQEVEALLAEARARLVELEANQLAEERALQHDHGILALLEHDLERAEQLSAGKAISPIRHWIRCAWKRAVSNVRWRSARMRST